MKIKLALGLTTLLLTFAICLSLTVTIYLTHPIVEYSPNATAVYGLGSGSVFNYIFVFGNNGDKMFRFYITPLVPLEPLIIRCYSSLNGCMFNDDEGGP